MLLTTLIVAASLHAPIQSTRAPAASETGNTSVETAEGVEILRRLLVAGLDEAFDTQEKKKAETFNYQRGVHVEGLVTTLWAGGRTVQHARAFHLPEAGLFIALDACLPVVAAEQSAPSDGGAPADDEWERARREVRGSVTRGTLRLRVPGAGPEGEIDPRSIDQAIDVALRTLARHVTRVEGLHSRETVTLALRLSGQSRGWLHGFGQEPGVWTTGEGREDKNELQTHSLSYVLASGQEAREQNVVLQIAVADLTIPEATPEQLRRAARINRY